MNEKKSKQSKRIALSVVYIVGIFNLFVFSIYLIGGKGAVGSKKVFNYSGLQVL